MPREKSCGQPIGIREVMRAAMPVADGQISRAVRTALGGRVEDARRAGDGMYEHVFAERLPIARTECGYEIEPGAEAQCRTVEALSQPRQQPVCGDVLPTALSGGGDPSLDRDASHRDGARHCPASVEGSRQQTVIR